MRANSDGDGRVYVVHVWTRVKTVRAQTRFPTGQSNLDTVPRTSNALHPLVALSAGRLAAADATAKTPRASRRVSDKKTYDIDYRGVTENFPSGAFSCSRKAGPAPFVLPCLVRLDCHVGSRAF